MRKPESRPARTFRTTVLATLLTGLVGTHHFAFAADLAQLDKLTPSGAEREGNKEQAQLYDMGKLVIVLREAGSTRRLWAATTLEPLSPDEKAREQTVNQAVIKLFATYPKSRK